MADWTKPYSPDFRSGGDLTNEVLAKMIPNETDIYTKLTALRNRQRSATPPTNPNVGDVWECSTTGSSYTADVVYRYNGSAWVEASSPAIASTARNVVLQGAVTTAGATALFTGSTAALTVQLNATDTPAVFSFMNGNSESTGAVDIIDSVAADDASFWTGLPQSSTVYLYVNYSAGTLTGGFTTVAPVYQSYAPTHASGKHWIDDNKGQVWSSNGSTWTQVYRVFVGEATTDTTKVTATTIYDYNVLRQNVKGNLTGNVTGNVTGDVTGTASGNLTTMPAGTVLQVVTVTKTDTFSTNSTSFTDVTGMSATITPSSTSNKIVVNVMAQCGYVADTTFLKLLRGSTDLCIGDASGSRTQATNQVYAAGGTQDIRTVPIMYVDSPSTTSATTYKIQAKTNSASYPFYFNRCSNDANDASNARVASGIILMEVKG